MHEKEFFYTDNIREAGIRAALGQELRDLPLQVLPVVDSTNIRLRKMAEDGAPDGMALIAGAQTAGKGRLGRTFYSPAGTGVYISLLLRQTGWDPELTGRITTMAAVAASEAVESVSGKKAGIKWVNDLYFHNKKVCGILTEAITDFESGNIEFAVVGIGLNLYMPEDGFPEDIQETAGALFENRNDAEHINCSILVAEIVNQLLMEVETPGLSREYTENNIIPGNMIVITDGQCTREAYAESIAPDGRLLVREQDGSETLLSYGEVSVRRKSDQG